MSNRGGRRPNAGRPSKNAEKERAEKHNRARARVEELAVAALPEALALYIEVMGNPKAELKDRMKAAEIILAHGAGKPGTKVQSIPDTTINVVVDKGCAPGTRGGKKGAAAAEEGEEGDEEDGIPAAE